MTLPFAAGQRLLASDLNATYQAGAWTTYTPVWTASITNPVINNGTIVGAYSKVGHICTVRVSVLMGSTTTIGSGMWGISLPFAPALGSGADLHAGAAMANNSGVAFYAGTAVVSVKLSSTTVEIISQAGGAPWGATVPAAWTISGSYFGFTLTYETTN